MNKKWWVVIVLSVIVVGLVILNIVTLKKGNKVAEPKIEENEVLGIVGYFNTDYDVFGRHENLFITSDSVKYGVIDKDNKVIIEMKYDSVYFIYDYIFGYGNNKAYIFDSNGKVIISGDSVKVSKYEGKHYFLSTIDGKGTVYDEDLKVIKEVDGYNSIVGKYVVTQDKLINFLEDEELSYKDAVYFGDKTAYVGEGKAIEIKESDGSYQIYKDSKCEVSYCKLGDNYYSRRGYPLTEDLKGIINDYYYYKYDYSKCPDGGVLIYDNDGKQIKNSCFMLIDYTGDIKQFDDYRNYSSIIFTRGEKYYDESSEKHYSSNGKYLGESGPDGFKLYDLDGKEMPSGLCDYSLEEGYDEYSVCHTKGGKYYFFNIDGDKSEEYDSIRCEDAFCIVEKNYNYQVLYHGELLTDSFFSGMSYNTNGFLVARSPFGNQVIVLGTENIIDDYKYVPNTKYEVINVDQTIKDYKLEYMETDIKNNEELFKKYAYIVNNNPKLVVTYNNKKYDYKKYVLNMFKMVINNKDYLNENYFFNVLGKLEFILDNNVKNGLAGVTLGDVISLDYYYADNAKVIYHELTHFIDGNIDKHGDFVFLVCNDEVSGIRHPGDTVQDGCYGMNVNSVFDEGGAEYYSGIYYSNMNLETYFYGTQTLAAFSYIFGDDVIEKLFFSPNTDEEFYNLLIGLGMSESDIIKFVDITSRIVMVGSSPTDDDYDLLLKYIVDIYKLKKGNEWYNDKEFMYVLNLLFGNSIRKARL